MPGFSNCFTFVDPKRSKVVHSKQAITTILILTLTLIVVLLDLQSMKQHLIWWRSSDLEILKACLDFFFFSFFLILVIVCVHGDRFNVSISFRWWLSPLLFGARYNLIRFRAPNPDLNPNPTPLLGSYHRIWSPGTNEGRSTWLHTANPNP